MAHTPSTAPMRTAAPATQLHDAPGVQGAPNPPAARHVALVGMPGAGKTSVGAQLAQALGLNFVDLDAAIEQEAQKSIAALFAEQGEVMFRAKERAQLRRLLAQPEPTVIACGGGTFADATMQRELLAAARPVLLTAPLPVLLARLEDDAQRDRRPLLHGPNPRAALERLWRSREAMHAQCPRQVDTEGRDVAELAAAVAALLQNEAPTPAPQAAAAAAGAGGDTMAMADATVAATPAATPADAVEAAAAPAAVGVVDVADAADSAAVVDVSDVAAAADAADGFTVADDGEADPAAPLLQVRGVRHTYPIYLVDEGAQAVAECIDTYSEGSRIALVTDTGVAPNHAGTLTEALRARGLTVSVHSFAAGEESKRVATALALYDELADAGHGRGDLLVALGGGLVGDVAGFVASTYMRGVPLLQVPTTTLAAVDASVGSKTGLNTQRGKNLVGSFYDPQAVIISLAYLGTQSPRIHVAGLVEALKCGALADAALFAAVQQAAEAAPGAAPQALRQAIGGALRIKAQLVEADVHEAGPRALLNLGHTLGHAIEVGERWRLPHGEAVALGMVAEAEYAESRGLAHGVVAPLVQALVAMGVPTDWRRAKIDVAALGRDKKRRGEHLTLPVVMPLGQASLHDVPLAELEAFVTAHTC